MGSKEYENDLFLSLFFSFTVEKATVFSALETVASFK